MRSAKRQVYPEKSSRLKGPLVERMYWRGLRAELQRLVSTGKAAAYKRTRAQILLKADQGPDGPAWSDQQICDAFDIGRVTVERSRKALVLEGLLAALQRKKRAHPPVPRKLDGSGEAQLIA